MPYYRYRIRKYRIFLVCNYVDYPKNSGGGLMGFNMYEIVGKMFAPVIGVIKGILFSIGTVVLIAAVIFILGFFIRYRVNPFRIKVDKLKALSIRFKPYDLIRWLLADILTEKDRTFKEYGFTFYCGRQGAGKTISMVNYLNCMKGKYPDCIIVTNFSYIHADTCMTDWRDLMEIRNGDSGVIFAIDEIHSEYSSASWKDFPETLLSEISQQRKQKVKIVATAQCFTRVAKPIREQAFSVVQCSTLFGRYTRNAEYDANEYAICMDNLFRLKKKCKRIGRGSFVQSDSLRNCYDTYEKIERMKKIEFLSRRER